MKSPPPEHPLQDCRSLCRATPRTSGTDLCFKLMAKCHLTPIGSRLRVERDIGDHGGGVTLCTPGWRWIYCSCRLRRGKSVTRTWCGLPGDAPIAIPPHPDPPRGWLTSFFLLPSLHFSAQVIYRALSPPYAAEDPYSAEAQAQLKITNLRVRLLERQGCPCLPAVPTPRSLQPPPPLHYAIYDFIVKGSCFCNGHADHCVPITGFKPVKAAGVFHVVCTRAQKHLRCREAEFLTTVGMV